MRNPLSRRRKRIFLGGEGMRFLWKVFPQAAFFEVYVPADVEAVKTELPLIIESTESRLVEPYTKMFYRLFTARETPLFRLLFMNVNCRPIISSRVAANLAITLAAEEIVTYLIDLDIRAPVLHDLFHVERVPGMMEFLLKGAEPVEIIRDTGIPELKFIPSGREVTDPKAVFSMLGWKTTLERLIPPGAVGLIYTSAGEWFDTGELMSEVDGTLLLFSSVDKIDRSIRRALKDLKKRSDVAGVIWTHPMEYPFRENGRAALDSEVGRAFGPEPRDETPGGEERFVEVTAGDEEGGAVLLERVDSDLEGSGESSQAESHAEGEDRPEEEVQRGEAPGGVEEMVGGRSEERGNRWLPRAVILVLFIGLAVTWLIYRRGAVSGGANEQAAAVKPQSSGEGIAPLAETNTGREAVRSGFLSRKSEVPFSVVLASFRNEASARAAERAVSQAGFQPYLVPVEIPGSGRWTRLMVGQYADESMARAELEDIAGKSDFKGVRVIRAPLAYLLGVFDSMDGAEEMRAAVEKLGLDPYILESRVNGNIYFLYLGAYEDEGQAGVARQLLAQNHLTGGLVNRKGYNP